jgi:hypothetical protein
MLMKITAHGTKGHVRGLLKVGIWIVFNMPLTKAAHGIIEDALNADVWKHCLIITNLAAHGENPFVEWLLQVDAWIFCNMLVRMAACVNCVMKLKQKLFCLLDVPKT